MRKILFLLDYDGTLTDFKQNPDKSNLKKKTLQILRSLKNLHRIILISGRDTRTLERVSGLKGWPMVGTHGFEGRNLPRGIQLATRTQERAYRKQAAQLHNRLGPLTKKYAKVHLERKPFSATLHYRGLGLSPVQIRDLQKGFKRIVRSSVPASGWVLQEGKMMMEAKPRGFSKGNAVKKIIQAHSGYLPIYAGDDLTDISALKALGKGGIRIAVGRRIPRKFYDKRFPSPLLFVHWLQRWNG